jgi:hypothetical protein
MDETPEQFSAGATAPDKRAREALKSFTASRNPGPGLQNQSGFKIR